MTAAARFSPVGKSPASLNAISIATGNCTAKMRAPESGGNLKTSGSLPVLPF